MAVNCAILSYNGTVYFGFSGDVHAAPDLRRLETLLQDSFTELRHGVGIRPPKQKLEKKEATKPAKKKVRRKRQAVSVAAAPVVLQVMSNPSQLEPERIAEPAPAPKQENVLAQLIVA